VVRKPWARQEVECDADFIVGEGKNADALGREMGGNHRSIKIQRPN
jgi:hypothetical protein